MGNARESGDAREARNADESGWLELLEVMLLVVDVVFDEETERDRRVVANYAACVEAPFGDAIDCGH